MALLKHYKIHTNLAASESKIFGFRGCFRSRSDFLELRLQSLAICDFEVAAIRVTKVGREGLWLEGGGFPVALGGGDMLKHTWPLGPDPHLGALDF